MTRDAAASAALEGSDVPSTMGTWFYATRDGETGPLPYETVRSQIQSGQLSPATPLRSAWMRELVPATELWSFGPGSSGSLIEASPSPPGGGSFHALGSIWSRLSLTCPRCKTEHTIDGRGLDPVAGVASQTAPSVDVRFTDVTLGRTMGSLMTFALLGAGFVLMQSTWAGVGGFVVGAVIGMLMGSIIGLILNGIVWGLSSKRKLIVLECHACGEKIFLGRRGDQIDLYASG